MKRFWGRATTEAGPRGHTILLDGKPMRIPGGPELLVEAAPLAHAIAAEWDIAGGGHKGGEMTMDDVPLTRLTGTAQDRIALDPAPVVNALAKYAETDVLCYRAAQPLPLMHRQALEWQPWLDWLDRTHGARLQPTEGITVLAQDDKALSTVREVLQAQPTAMLAGLGIAIPALGSVVLGLALADGALDAEAAHALAHLDELFQEEHWGQDVLATTRRAGVIKDIALAARFMALVRQV